MTMVDEVVGFVTAKIGRMLYKYYRDEVSAKELLETVREDLETALGILDRMKKWRDELL